jgi:hypothetical protein
MTSASGYWPGTGAQTLYWTFYNAPTAGGSVIIIFVKGLNTSTPTRSTDAKINSSSFTSALASVAAGDLSFVMGMDESYQSVDASGNGQTVLASNTSDNACDWEIAYEQGEDGMIIASPGSSLACYIAFALRVA